MLVLKRLLKYTSVNVVLLPLNLSIAWGLTHVGLHYLLATVAGFAVQITIAFFINREWTFKRPQIRTIPGLFRASIVEVIAFVVIVETTYIAVELLDFSFLWGRLLASLTAGATCYVLDSVFTFRVARER